MASIFCRIIRSWLAVIILTQTCIVEAASDFYPFGLQNNDKALPKEDDAFTTIGIQINFPFFGNFFSQIHVSTNGIIFFGQGSTDYVPRPYPLNGTLSVAAYWVDSDPREGGDIFYREELNPVILNQITNFIRNKFIQFKTFTSTWSFIATFNNVPHWSCQSSTVFPCPNVVKHQTILTSDGVNSFVIFLYDKLEYANAQIGFNAGDGKRYFLVPYSNTVNISKYALENSNVGSAGKWMFSISNEILAACNPLGKIEISPKKVLFFGQQEVNITGPCLEHLDKIDVQFGSDIVTCQVTGYIIKCLTPFFDSNIKVSVSINYNQTIYKSFIFSYDTSDSLVKTNSVILLNDSTNFFELKWNPALVDANMVYIRGVQQTISHDKNLNILKVENINILKYVSNTGVYRYDIQLLNVIPTNRVIRFLINIQQNVFIAFTTVTVSCDAWYKSQPKTEEINAIKEIESKRNPCLPIAPDGFPYQLPGGFKKDDSCNPNNPELCRLFHKGATGCYRSTNNPNNIAVQCCYDANGKLLAGPTGGGTLDMADSDKSSPEHFMKDVVPYFVCCVFSNECDKYYEKRPSVSSENYYAPKLILAGGDPHFNTLDRIAYDFNPHGEFIYTQSQNIMVQAKIQQLGSTGVSIFSGFAIKVLNYSPLQIDLIGGSDLQLKFENELLNETVLNFGFANTVLISRIQYNIDTIAGINIQIFNYNGLGFIILTFQPQLKTKVGGLVGYWDDDQTNDFMLPNGTWIPITSSPRDKHYVFGMSWSTTNETSIFTYPNGLKWIDFQNQNLVPYFGQPPVDPRCRGNVQCSYDTYITGDINIGLANVVVEAERNRLTNLYEQMNVTCDSYISIPYANVTIQSNNNNTNVNYSISCKRNYTISGNSFVRCINGTLLEKFGNCVESQGVCSPTKTLQIYPKKVIFFGQQDLNIKGPCFEENIREIKVKIGVNIVTCKVVENETKCLTPYFDNVGTIPVSLEYNNVTYTSFIFSYNLGDRLVQKNTAIPLNESTTFFEIKWDETQINTNVTVLRGVYQTISFEKNMNIVNVEFINIYQNVSNTGVYRLNMTLFGKFPLIGLKASRFLININQNVYTAFTIGQLTCKDWNAKQLPNKDINTMKENESKLNPCPPSVTIGFTYPFHVGFEMDDSCNVYNLDLCRLYQKEAASCYRSTNNPNNIAVQCCYDVFGKLMLGPKGGGTLDMADSDRSNTEHFIKDVVPYFVCCLFTNDCDRYYEKRPSVGSGNYTSPSIVYASGDPHFNTLDGIVYNFNPHGEYIFMQSRDIMVQARMRQLGSTGVSLLSGFAIKVSNYSPIQIDLVGNSDLQLKFENELLNETILKFDFANTELIDKNNYQIDTIAGINVEIFNIDSFGYIRLTMQPYLKRMVQGLVGYWDDDKSNDFMLSNRTWIQINSSARDLHYVFGMSWSTTNETSIFTYPNGLNWNDFQNPNFVPYFGQPPADSRCGGNEECSYDTFITGDINIGLANVAQRNESNQLNEKYRQMNLTCNSQFFLPYSIISIQYNSDYTNVNYSITCMENYTLSGNSLVRCVNGTLLDSSGACLNSKEVCGSKILEIYPKKVLFFGQQDLTVKGPCLDENIKEINVQIGNEFVTCQVSRNEIKCLTPYIDSIAKIPVSFEYNNEIYRSFIFTYDIGDPLVERNTVIPMNESTTYFEIKWNQTQIMTSVAVLRGVYQVISYDGNMNILDIESVNIYRNVSNTGAYVIDLTQFGTPSSTQHKAIRFLLNINRNAFMAFTTGQFTCKEWNVRQLANKYLYAVKENENKRNPCQPTVSNKFSYQLPGMFKWDESCNPNNPDLCRLFHKGAKGCYRSTYNPNNIAVQCCYDAYGKLLAGPTGGGTLDMADSDRSNTEHFIKDVVPYFVCCIFSNECDKYYEKRPSVSSENYTPPSGYAYAQGDPHFYTFNGVAYDFQPFGELILMQSQNVMVQIRTHPWGSRKVTIISAHAIKILNFPPIQIEIMGTSDLKLKFENEYLDETFLNFGFANIELTNRNKYNIYTYVGVNIQIQNYFEMGFITITTQPYLKKNVKGLLGYWDDNRLNDFMLPDGNWIPLNSSLRDIHYIFGMSWSTTNETSIFTYPDGLNWNDFQNPNFVPYLEQPPFDPRCRGNAQCSYDTFVTGDINIGLANVDHKNEVEKLKEEYRKMNMTCDSQVYMPYAVVDVQSDADHTNVNYSITCLENSTIVGNSFFRCVNGTLLDQYGICVMSSANIISANQLKLLFVSLFFIIISDI